MQIFSGSSNSELAGRIAEIMQSQSSEHLPKSAQGSELLGAIEISQFSNGETRVWVKEKKVEKSVVVVQSLSTPTNEHLIEFCLICDALRRGGATEITAVIPWMGYSKQDKVFRAGEPLSAKVAAQILQVARPARIITFDLHNRATLGFFDVPVCELSAKPLLLEYFRNQLKRKVPNSGPESSEPGGTVVAAPDAGSVKASTAFAAELGVSVVYMDKKRDLVSGEVKVVGMSRSVKGLDVIVVDDNVFTGSTLLQTAKELKKAGAKTIRVGLTHHLYVPGVQEKLEASEIDEIVVSDTIQRIGGKLKAKSKKLVVLSVAKMIVDELQ